MASRRNKKQKQILPNKEKRGLRKEKKEPKKTNKQIPNGLDGSLKKLAPGWTVLVEHMESFLNSRSRIVGGDNGDHVREENDIELSRWP